MECPTCDEASLGYESLHRHLIARHPELVAIVAKGSRPSYRVNCPLCEEVYVQAIKRGHPEDGFIEEFEVDIRLVGMDILVQHLIGEHPNEVGYHREEEKDE